MKLQEITIALARTKRIDIRWIVRINPISLANLADKYYFLSDSCALIYIIRKRTGKCDIIISKEILEDTDYISTYLTARLKEIEQKRLVEKWQPLLSRVEELAAKKNKTLDDKREWRNKINKWHKRIGQPPIPISYITS